MLITLRNSGAKWIHCTDNYDDELTFKILDKIAVSEANGGGDIYHSMLKSTNIESFIVDKNGFEFIHLENKSERSYMSSDNKQYNIKIKYSDRFYDLYYGEVKPDFFKVLFKYFYPEQADKQVEELV